MWHKANWAGRVVNFDVYNIIWFINVFSLLDLPRYETRQIIYPSNICVMPTYEAVDSLEADSFVFLLLLYSMLEEVN